MNSGLLKFGVLLEAPFIYNALYISVVLRGKSWYDLTFSDPIFKIFPFSIVGLGTGENSWLFFVSSTSPSRWKFTGHATDYH